MTRSTIRVRSAAAVAVAGALVIAACGGDDAADSAAATEAPASETATAESDAESASAEPATSTAAPASSESSAGESESGAAVGAVDLASVCPNPIVIQTNWYPQASLAWYYQLVGPGGEVDAANGRYSAPAIADPSVTIEIRGGGPMLGFQQGNTLMYTDPDILITDQNLDAMIAGSKELPTVALMAPMELHPQILMWDPEALDISSIEDIKASGATVLVASNATYAEALAGIGALDPAQIDFGYDFSPSRFVAETGIVQQGFSTSEPYFYENVLEAWRKPIDYMLINDAGYPNYAAVVSTRAETLTAEADCFTELIPLLQQAVVDYVSDPGPVNALIEQLTKDWNSPTPLTPAETAFATESLLSDGIVANGSDATVGNFDIDRVQTMIDLTVPVFVGQDSDTVDPDITADVLVTNEFIDPSIGL